MDVSRGRVDEGEASLVAAAERSRALGDRFALAQVLAQVAQLAEDRGDFDGAESALLEAMDQVEPLDAREDVAWLSIRLGWVRGLAGDEAGGRRIAEGVDRARDIGASETEAMGLYLGATLARHHGDLPAARQGYQRSLEVMESAGAAPSFRAYPLVGLGFVAEQEGDPERAEASHRRAVELLLEVPAVSMWTRLLLADAVEGLAGAAATAGRAEHAATLVGAAESLRARLRAWAPQRMDRERVSAAARGLLGAEPFERARRRGEAMTVEEVLAVIAS
jgi:tetratricopeptide (TPR) repeat protein